MRHCVMVFALRSVGLTYPAGYVLEAHSHAWGQVIFASSGTMRVFAENTLWLVPPGRALWAPPTAVHTIHARGELAMRTIYVPPERGGVLPNVCTAIEVTVLLRELILHVVNCGLLNAADPEQERLAQFCLDQLARAKYLVLHLPMPSDARMLSIANRLCDDPAHTSDLPTLARQAGASARTVQRLFREETGMRFVEWRQRLRLIEAISELERGATVTQAGVLAGYASTSAFIAAFKEHIGETPKRYLKFATTSV